MYYHSTYWDEGATTAAVNLLGEEKTCRKHCRVLRQRLRRLTYTRYQSIVPSCSSPFPLLDTTACTTRRTLSAGRYRWPRASGHDSRRLESAGFDEPVCLQRIVEEDTKRWECVGVVARTIPTRRSDGLAFRAIRSSSSSVHQRREGAALKYSTSF